MTTFTFNDRDSYIAFRKDWKERYKAQTETIRQHKRDIVRMHVALKEAETATVRYGIEEKISTLQSHLAYERRQANAMMTELMEAKEFKNEQLAAHAAVAA